MWPGKRVAGVIQRGMPGCSSKPSRLKLASVPCKAASTVRSWQLSQIWYVQVLSAQQGMQLTFAGVAQDLLRREGPRALWAGLGARVAMMGPGAAVSWAVYEQTKAWMARTC